MNLKPTLSTSALVAFGSESCLASSSGVVTCAAVHGSRAGDVRGARSRPGKAAPVITVIAAPSEAISPEARPVAMVPPVQYCATGTGDVTHGPRRRLFLTEVTLPGGPTRATE